MRTRLWSASTARTEMRMVNPCEMGFTRRQLARRIPLERVGSERAARPDRGPQVSHCKRCVVCT